MPSEIFCELERNADTLDPIRSIEVPISKSCSHGGRRRRLSRCLKRLYAAMRCGGSERPVRRQRQRYDRGCRHG